jgi:phage tail-like protein
MNEGRPMLKIAVMALALALVASAASAVGRFDPYKSYRFVLYMNGRAVAGANRVDLPASQDVVEYRAGNDPLHVRKLPGRNKYETITLQRGLTHDVAFANWAASAGAGAHASLGLKSFDLSGRLQASYRLTNCWTSSDRALPPLNGKGNDVAIEHLELQCERLILPGHP